MPLGELALKRIPLLNLVGPPFHAKLVVPGKTEGRVVSTALESTNPESPPPPFVSGFGFLGCDGVGEGPGANLLDCWSEHTGGELGGQRKAAGGKVGSRWASGKVDAGHSLTAGRTAERRAREGSEACRVPHRKCLFEALIVGLGLPERASRGRLRQETGTRSSPGLPGVGRAGEHGERRARCRDGPAPPQPPPARSHPLSFRTKWKRQTAVGLELLAEAGNYSALQRMFPSPYFYHPSLLGSMDSTTAAAAAAAMYSSMYRTPPAPHPQLQRPLVPRVLIHGLGPGGQPALNPLSNPIPGTPHPR